MLLSVTKKFKKILDACLYSRLFFEVAMIFFLKKLCQPGPLLFIFGLFEQTIQFLKQNNLNKFHDHRVYSAGIRTHDLSNMSHLPKPLDQKK